MEIQERIVNKVEQSGLITFNLEDHMDNKEQVVFDIADNLFQKLILKEKDFREFIKGHNWEQYAGKHVAIICSVDAIVPTWAYMLLSNRMANYADEIVFGNLETLKMVLFEKALSKIDFKNFTGERVVIKGCSNENVPVAAYVIATRLLTPYAKSIFFGEPCSTVPIYKKKE